MRMTTSFTGSRGVRYPAPDVARGFMLLLIAVANVPSWNKMPNGAEPPVSSVDGWWMFVRTLVVDHRAYPLFAMLFGFGLMTMINRRIASGTQTYLASLPGAAEGREPMPHEAAWAREMATIDAYGLVLGALAAFHGALTLATTVQLWPWDFAMTEFFGLAGACGWLALLALYAGGPRPDGRLTGLRWLASAVGRRSMTVYLSQTILFGIIFGVVPLLVTGRRLWMGQAAAALVALGVWLASVVLCAALERGGRAGPFETLLRTAVARSERRRPTPPPPPAVWPGMQAGPQPAP